MRTGPPGRHIRHRSVPVWGPLPEESRLLPPDCAPEPPPVFSRADDPISRQIAAAGKVVRLPSGAHHVTSDPDTVMVALLGSCVAVCLRDGESGAAGMNHFLVPGIQRDDKNQGAKAASHTYGAPAMDWLLSELLGHRAGTGRLEAKVFGGADLLLLGLPRIGSSNAKFALNYLALKGIKVAACDVGGHMARYVCFRPATGQVWVRHLQREAAVIHAVEAGGEVYPPSGKGRIKTW